MCGLENGVPGAGFEPAKLYAEDLESTPFDRSGTPACVPRSNLLFLTIALHQSGQDLSALAGEDSERIERHPPVFGCSLPSFLVGGTR